MLKTKAQQISSEAVSAPLLEAPVLDMARYVPALLIHISNKMSNGANATYRRLFGVGVTDWRVLSQLAIEPGASASRIAEVVGFDKAIISRVVASLREADLVRVDGDGADSRRHSISLTAKGRRMHDRIIKVALERERLLLSGLSPREVDQLCNLLGRLHAKVQLANDYDPARVLELEEGMRR